jgi:hypothetical protein
MKEETRAEDSVRVFISYSWDSREHKDRVRVLVDRLLAQGIDCVLDQYEHPPPPQGWPTWMKEQVGRCEFVLVVCSEGYVQKADGKVPGAGLGVRFESAQVLQGLYERGMWNERVLPVLVGEGGVELVWEPLRPYQFYRADTDEGYEDLYRRLTGQPALVKPPLGPRLKLPPRNLSPSGGVSAPDRTPVHASGWSKTGEDENGRWAAFAVQGVEQRMRWIPPGRFWMGSLSDEEGRWDDEGPRHEVELTRGFWLGEVPCTQALWEAVMGSNPSRFKGRDRPVEQVSWRIAGVSWQRCPGWWWVGASAFRRKRSGSTRAVLERRRLGTRAIPAPSSGTPGTLEVRLTLLLAKRRTPGACTTCWVMSGSGARTSLELTPASSSVILEALPVARTG